jgi:NAD-reducing hydrogenase large subunit
VPGGVRSPLSAEGRQWMLDRLPESFTTIHLALDIFKRMLDGSHQAEINVFGAFPSLFMGLVGANGEWEHYDGHLRFTDSQGNIVADNLSEDDYGSFLGEAVEPWSYLKFPYYQPLGYPDGIYRVGPLARLNVCQQIGMVGADRELQNLRDRSQGTPTSSFLYHYARLIEILACLEHIQALLDDPELLSSRVRAQGGVNQLNAIGVSEAPRGTLFHHYQVDENGLIERVNLIIATGQNNLAMNKTITQIAQAYIHNANSGHEIPEGLLNRVEAGIRCFDPCLSCSTHAVGQMPLHVQLVNIDGDVVSERFAN